MSPIRLHSEFGKMREGMNVREHKVNSGVDHGYGYVTANFEYPHLRIDVRVREDFAVEGAYTFSYDNLPVIEWDGRLWVGIETGVQYWTGPCIRYLTTPHPGLSSRSVVESSCA